MCVDFVIEETEHEVGWVGRGGRIWEEDLGGVKEYDQNTTCEILKEERKHKKWNTTPALR